MLNNILNDWRINMKKIIILLVLIMTIVGCELFDSNFWDEIHEEDKERGRRCYERDNGTFYCRDKYGNPA